MKEKIINLFLFISNGFITDIGAIYHHIDGSDAHKIEFLKSQVENDCKSSRKYKVPSRYIYISEEKQVTPGIVCYKNLNP